MTFKDWFYFWVGLIIGIGIIVNTIKLFVDFRISKRLRELEEKITEIKEKQIQQENYLTRKTFEAARDIMIQEFLNRLKSKNEE